jgi:cytidylate kinase
VVAIDGPSGSGKSTVARRVAQKLGYRYLDTGAMYRAVTWLALDRGVDLADGDALAALAEGAGLEPGTNPRRPTIAIDGTDVTAPIRGRDVTNAVSAVSAVPRVRAAMVRRQRELMDGGSIVVEGRDIGTTVAPDAPVKVFLTASSEARAARRHRQFAAVGEAHGENVTREEIERRDARDAGRAASPLAQASDAVVVDSTARTVDEVVGEVLSLAERRGLPTPRTKQASEQQGEAAAPPPVSHIPPRSPRRAALPDVPVLLWLYRPLKVIARTLIRLLLDVRVEHSSAVPSRGPVLLAGNHRGALDGPLLAAFTERPARFVAKSELFKGWTVRPLGWLGQIPIDRGRADREALRKAVGVLRQGHVLGMFPEGTRGAGELTTVQHGIAYVALRVPGVTIVPVACIGTERALPKGAKWPKLRTRVDIVFGEPFTVTVPDNPRARSAIATAAEEIRQALAAHVERAERARGPR